MKKHVIKFCFLSIVLMLVLIDGIAQTKAKNDLPRGAVIEKVAPLDDNIQSYALYIPTNYTPEKKWAVLYAFDPSAQGKVPVEIFREAAEKLGFIVVGSNNSRNNLNGQELSQIVDAFWAETHARLSIDEKRTYAAGFSGGARVATSFAASCGGCVAGVIASGATFMSRFSLDKPLSYSIFGAVGADDFNYPEMIKNFEKLNQLESSNRLDVFDGGHQWLTKDSAFDALEWLNLQSMKSGAMKPDEKFVEELKAKQKSKAQSLLQNGDVLGAARNYETIVKDFKDISDTKDATEKLSEIRGQKTYKKALADEKNQIAEQQKAAAKIMSASANLIDLAAKAQALKNISDEIENWRQKAKETTDSSERRLARRILGQVFISTYESALQIYRPKKDYQMMIASLEVARLIRPLDARVLLEFARAYSLAGQKKNALDLLEQSVKNGFSDCAALHDKAEWSSLRDEKRFQKVSEQLKCEGK